MGASVSLRKVLDELELLSDESNAYINRQTGELYTVLDEEAALVEDGEDTSDLPDWQRDELPKVAEVLNSDDWVPLPTKFDIHEWEIMDEFALSLDDEEMCSTLRSAIRGKGAFRLFKSAIFQYGIEQDWYQFRTSALERIAIQWLDEYQISYTRDEEEQSPQQ